MATTASERKALLFLAGLLVLGATTRMVASLRAARDIGADNPAALTGQIAAVDSERVRVLARRSRRSSEAPRAGRASRSRSKKSSKPDSAIIVNVDHASAAELEALPRVGPALARRIVQDREENGPFGSLDALTRVNGIGPKLVMQLAAHVTFSGSARPPTALSVSPGALPRVGRNPPPG